MAELERYANAVERGKPAPDVFITGAGWLGVPPSVCVVVKDSVAGEWSTLRRFPVARPGRGRMQG